MSKLTGNRILDEIKRGQIKIDPFKEKNINPHSYNVTLANDFLIYTGDYLDMAQDNGYITVRIENEEGILLMPNRLYLARTVERIHTDFYAPVYDGRSSIGRLGIFTHVTAGYIDVGFNGFITLEIAVVEPVKIYPGVKIGQVSFETLEGEITLYNSDKYQNNKGIQPSKIWKEFQK